METNASLWTDFPPMDLNAWWHLIDKELRGAPRTDLDWEVEPGVPGQAVYHHPEQDYGGPLRIEHGGAWHIMETVVVEGDPVAANRQALEALQMGAQSLHFTGAAAADIPVLLEGILLEVCPVYWSLAQPGDASGVQAALERVIAGSDLEASTVRGGWMPSPALPVLVAPPPVHAGWDQAMGYGPVTTAPGAQLSHLLAAAHQALDRARPEERAGLRGLVTFSLGQDYLTEIARLRAWRIVWAHLMRSWGLPESQPCTVVGVIEPDSHLAWEDTFIPASTRALSAILGGVDHLDIRPPAHARPDMVRRLARNVQHLLKEEAHMHRVADPMAGSYALESLTLALAEKAWADFHP